MSRGNAPAIRLARTLLWMSHPSPVAGAASARSSRRRPWWAPGAPGATCASPLVIYPYRFGAGARRPGAPRAGRLRAGFEPGWWRPRARSPRAWRARRARRPCRQCPNVVSGRPVKRSIPRPLLGRGKSARGARQHPPVRSHDRAPRLLVSAGRHPARAGIAFARTHVSLGPDRDYRNTFR